MSVLLIAVGSGQNPDRLRPTFASEVLAPEERTIVPLLKALCGDGVRTVTPEGEKAFGCGAGMDEILAEAHTTGGTTVEARRRRVSWRPYILWQADGVLFGHFLSPTSDDAVINCFACGGHPDLYGGSVLLTRQSGRWQPVWFKRGIIVRHCRQITLAAGRHILVCEEPDGGMGHAIHGLYTVDFTNPKFAWHSVLLMADSYSDPMLGGVQAQFIDRVQFDESGQGELLVRVFARHGRIKLRPDYRGESFPKPRLSHYEIDFRLEGEWFKLTPETAGAGRLFDLGTR